MKMDATASLALKVGGNVLFALFRRKLPPALDTRTSRMVRGSISSTSHQDRIENDGGARLDVLFFLITRR
jgi:hypothetical protein